MHMHMKICIGGLKLDRLIFPILIIRNIIQELHKNHKRKVGFFNRVICLWDEETADQAYFHKRHASFCDIFSPN